MSDKQEKKEEKKPNKAIYNCNFRKVDNGYYLDYAQEGKAHARVFHTWAEMSAWLAEQIPEQDHTLPINVPTSDPTAS